MPKMPETRQPAADWDGASYHRVSEPQFAWGLTVLQRLPLAGDETVVDAGCGSGRLTAELLERLPAGHVIALDRSASMLEVARRELQPRFGDRVSFVHADLLDLDLDAVADVVFSTATFHWVLDHPRLFRILRRALRPGGRLHAQCGGAGNIQRAHQRAVRVAELPDFAPYFATWTDPWEYAGADLTDQRLRDAGFTDVHTAIEAAPATFADRATYREFIRTVIMRPFLAPLLPDSNLQDRMLDLMCDAAADDDPPWTLDYQRLNMSATRPRS